MSMKLPAMILIAVLAVHLQCGSSCLVDSLASATTSAAPTTSVDPPCHKHEDVPADHSQHSDSTSNRCGQGSTIAAKDAFAGKPILMVISAVMPASVTIVLPSDSFVPADDLGPPGPLVPIVSSSVLRI